MAVSPWNPSRPLLAALSFFSLVLLWPSGASAQPPAFQCVAYAAVPPTVKTEGLTELVGDLVLICTGGTPTPVGAPVLTSNITIFYNTAVTNRLLADPWSEPLLIVNDPAPASQFACNSVSGVCAVTGTGGTSTYDGSTGHPNIFQSQVNANSVTFVGIPIDPPPPLGSLVLRITNVRVNASALPPGALPAQVVALVSADNLPLNNPKQFVGFTTYSLNMQVRTADNSGLLAAGGFPFDQCSAADKYRFATLRFGEAFPTAFRTRTIATFVDPNTSPPPVPQNFPGAVYNAESGFYSPSLSGANGNLALAGLADFGTRVKAVFHNIPDGVSPWVATEAVAFASGIPVPKTTGIRARLITSETGVFSPTPAGASPDGIPAAQLSVTNRTASAVWEVLAANPLASENVDVPVWLSYTASGAGTGTLNGSYAPVPPAFSPIDGAKASASLPLPRFLDFSTASNLFVINACITVSPTNLPNATLGQAYTTTLTATGGTPGYTWSVVSGSPPSGITLAPNGQLSGTPLAAGSYSFLVRVVDSVGRSVEQAYVLAVQLTISGQVSLLGGGLGGVTMTLSGSQSGLTTTDGSGNYSFSGLTAFGNYTITPSRAGYAFGPPAATFNNMALNQTANFTASVLSYSISGQVTFSGSGLSGVTMTLSGSQSGTTTTDGAGNYGFAGLAAGGNYTVTPSRSGYLFAPANATFNNLASSQTANFTAFAGLQFYPVTPCRVADTRWPNGPFGGPAMSGGQTRNFTLPAGSCGIPANALAFSLNVTVVPRGALGYLTTWPAGLPRPIVSTLNSYDGRVKADAAIVPAGAGGAVSVYVTDTTDVVLDVNGYFAAPGGGGALAFYPVTPCRVFDTRWSTGPFGGPSMGAGQSRDFAISSGGCGIPASAQAYAMNFTVVPRTGFFSYLSIWPAGQARPTVSTLNAYTGAVTANAALVPAGAGGAISLFTGDAAEVIGDINGYFAPPGPGGLSLYAITPCRVVDTRWPTGPFGGPALNGERSFALPAGACGLPAANAYSLNATVVPQPQLGYLTLWPGGIRPVVSTLNSLDGSVVSNAAIVAAASGSISAFASQMTDLILDVNGFFAP